ncbi:hypothetical protein AO825_08410 [Pectobacterium brasiliense]|uniref:hypothetical protein n=1 Tax=Pectobacterium brasiliense TaxID=180957 RepID=UPI0001A444D4|nr:hypothetical protein [Pectobacterium brasiliense]KGA24934.1 hypothetical protein KS44_06390 [Pectobacterium brasiliense]KRF62873.1 hypothetical protein AO825_08410 [Pectobacterium brasiliense]MBN3186083.1 hypothetical protein [Pectobacterium brasiliense]QHG26914.1 hypothetical protein GT391_01950 [Pectobacterium brasiliense]
MWVHEILEQHAIFDGKPDFMDGSLIINTLNHKSYGGTPAAMRESNSDPDMKDPKRYLVRVTIEYEEVN